ncbi:hypothetical protein [Staphylococcus aureus]|uniref:hypothetical protein n=1 Tax=Staphylococcus aureus TaxID=1280 RepID=UPI00044A11AB|nr:hypothetical protein [Staphylococcus aureus]EWR66041.1 hypothetical protein T969_02783 [Staphylococcus aureus FVRH6079]HDA9871749.1 hypothetical protein [Staphylococcus aureus]
MELIRLNQSLFNDEFNKNEIEDNKNGARPYYYSFQRNNNRVCIPLRTNARSVPEDYKLNLGHIQTRKPFSAIDTTKTIVMDNQTYLNNRTRTNINNDVYNYIKSNKQTIEDKFDQHTNDYISAKSNLANTPLVRFSTLQYFHDELNIQPAIDNGILKNSIQELKENGNSTRFNKLKDSIPQFKDTIEKYETLHEFSNLSPYQSTIIDEDINNPTLEIKKGDKTFSLTTEHIEKDTDKYFKDFLNYEHKDKQHNKDNELDL